VSRDGVFPLAASFDHVGPITRSVADAALVLHCIAGPDPRDPSTRRQAAPPAEPAPRDDFKRVRIGWDEDYVTMGVVPEVIAAVRAARDRMEALGATIVPVELPDLETTLTTFTSVFDVEMRAAHAGLYPDRALDYGLLARHALAHFSTRDPLIHVGGAIEARARNYWKSSFLAELSDEAIDVLIAQFAICPSPMSGLVLEHFHGAATRVGVGETAFAHRRESYNLMVVSQWLDPKDDGKNIAWARATYDALRPHMARESYANYQTEDETEGASEQAYGPNYGRLIALKNELDPTNFFHLNSNVRPTV
jgi:hypothetical protein